jgi:hypothetical protein
MWFIAPPGAVTENAFEPTKFTLLFAAIVRDEASAALRLTRSVREHGKAS